MGRRASSSPAAVGLLVALTVVLAGVAAGGLLGTPLPTAPPQPALELSVDPGPDRVELAHLGGDALDAGRLRVRVSVGGEPLAHQPPVPFFAARGFRAGPTGPFNSAADPRWTPGETAGFRLASTNSPGIEPGDRVRVELFVGGVRIARLTAVA